MCVSIKKMTTLIFWVCLLSSLCLSTSPGYANQAPDDVLPNILANTDRPKDGIYTSLTSLVNDICNDAIRRFDNFFTPSEVTVHPFPTMNKPPRELSILGMVLADQMAAVINNETSERFAARHKFTKNQELTGVIQELDGFLRIKISGKNERGEKRSHVVAVEMSAPLYRALHSTASP